ncbi:MAG: hypothetical protein JSR53_00120 [Proteobacteria bacterium]|nr:hypothetical protein [Pseudomonadota bacterium]
MSTPVVETIKRVSNRLLFSLMLLVMVLIVFFLYHLDKKETPMLTLPIVLIFGAIGAFVSLQRRLKSLAEEDLQLLMGSISYTWLAPMTGALLAGMLYLIFIGKLIIGPMFPEIMEVPAIEEHAKGLAKIFDVECREAKDYAKLLFWSFLAGFSESFVTDILGKFSQPTEKI